MLSLLCFALVGALIGIMAPASTNDSMRRGISVLVGMCILCALCEPAAAAVNRWNELPETLGALLLPDRAEAEKIYEASEERVIRAGVRNIESGVNALVAARFSLNAGEIATEAKTERLADGTVEVVSLWIGIETAACSPESIESYIEELFRCPCTVVQLGGEDGKNNFE